MEMQTLDDVLAWVTQLQSLGLEDGPYPPQELGQAVVLFMPQLAEIVERLAEHDRRLAEHDRRLAAVDADQARLDAALAAGDDLDVFQAGYETGYRLGWEHALQAAKAAGPRDFLTGQP